MASINFVFRPSVRSGAYPGSLSLRVIINRKPKTISLSCYLYPNEWDSRRQAIIYPADNPERTIYLRSVEANMTASVYKMNGIIREMEQLGHYTADDVIDRFRLAPDDGNLLTYASALASTLHRRRQKRLANAYTTVCRGLVKFNKGKDIPLPQINAELVRNFENYLKESGKQPNTISYYMRNLRAIYNKAVEAGRVSRGERPFSGVFTGVEETKKRALTASEVSKIANINFKSLLNKYDPESRQYKHLQNLYHAQRLFFFCLYTQGMCFVDICFLKKGNIHGEMIRYYRKKTGKQIEVPINEGMRQIIDSFADETAHSDYLFPILEAEGLGDLIQRYETALRTQNRRLKRVAELAGLDKEISTHVARHSWASILKNKMQPLAVISEGLGHSSEKMTRKYLDSFERSVLGDAAQTLLRAIARPSDDAPADS
jgi:integrase